MTTEALRAAPDGPLPRHIAIIMDGNGRWAKARGLARADGHQQGAEAATRAVTGAMDLGVPYLTLFSFSSENWNRPSAEVQDLMGLLRRHLRGEISRLRDEGICLRVIGERERLPEDILQLIEDAELQSRQNVRLTLTMALSYGGRREIADTARRLAEAVAAGTLDPAQIDEALFASRLWTADTPDPDLLIRTSGEQRISNFLLWQTAYSELVFIDKLWPDFAEADLADAVRAFQLRDRRYGAAVVSG